MNFVRVFMNLFQFNRTNWKAVILCLLAASVFWLFNAFNKSHSSTIRFPLHFEFNNQQFVAVSPLPHEITINVTGSGWDLIRKTFGMKVPDLVISLDRPLETKKIPATALTPVLISQLRGLQINYILTDTLYLNVDEKISKTFKLSANLNRVKFREGFGNISAVKLSPDSVVIDGPKSIISTIPDTIVLMVQGKQISKSFHDELEVPLYNSESINRNPPVISVKVEVGPVEQIGKMIKLKAVNQSQGLKSYFTDSVKVIIQVPVNKKEDLRQKLSQLNAMLDLRNVITRGSYQLLPKIIGLPIYAQVVSIDSVSFKID